MTAWDLAACAGEDPELWMVPRPGGRPSRRAGSAWERAMAPGKAICAGCPIRAACLAEHLDEPHGVFGGYDEVERAALRSRAGQTSGPAEARPEAERLKEHPEGCTATPAIIAGTVRPGYEYREVAS